MNVAVQNQNKMQIEENLTEEIPKFLGENTRENH